MFDTPRATKRRKTTHGDDATDVELNTPRLTRSAGKGVTPRSTTRRSAVKENGVHERTQTVPLNDASADELGDQAVTINETATTTTTPSRRTPRTRKQDGTIKENGQQEIVQQSIERPGVRSSGRQRRAPRKYSPEAPKSTPRASAARGSPAVVHLVEEVAVTPSSNIRRKLRFEEDAAPAIIRSPAPSRSRRGQRWKDVLEVEETPEVEMEEVSIAEPVIEDEEEQPAEQMDIDMDVDAKQAVYEDAVDYLDPTTIDETIGQDFSMSLQPPPQSEPITQEPAQYQDQPDIAFLKTIVLGKLTGHRPMPLIDLSDEHRKVHHLLEQTVVAGEGNSMLVIGARGTGKTALVNTILRDLSRTHADHFHVIRLNGFIHTDDKLALREIWRQLGREMEIEEAETGMVKNYADTLATLLALLSHPSEQGMQVDGDAAVTAEVAKSVVFIMDEFDLFAAHPRQTLLYNLFDIAQARKAPIAVLGLTTRVDAAETLEKRVKSRFSHRYVHLSLAKNLPSFLSICKAALRVDYEELDFEERTRLTSLSAPAVKTPTRRGTPASAKKSNYMDTLTAWNTAVDSMLAGATTTSALTTIYRTTKSIPQAFTYFLLPVTMLQVAVPNPDKKQAATNIAPSTISLAPPDSKLTLLPTLPTLPLILLISAARLAVVLDTPLTNFNMAYAEYQSIAQRARVSGLSASSGGGIGGRVWTREVARGAWEVLIERGIVVGVEGSVGGVRTGVGKGNEMGRVDVALEEIEGALVGVDGRAEVEEGLLRWCREI